MTPHDRPDRLTGGQARRMALGAQGLDRERPRRADIRHLRRALNDMGVVQLDFVNVLVPAHFLVLFSRVGPYDMEKLQELVYRRGEFTEAWAHEASMVPVNAWSLVTECAGSNDRRLRALEKFMEAEGQYAEEVLEELRDRGPLTAAEVESGEDRRVGSKGWAWPIQKAALEAHFVRGTVAIAKRRSNFARVYDIAERVLPPEHLGVTVEREEVQRKLLLRAAEALGVGTADDLADYFRMPIREARARLAELVEAGALRETSVEGWGEAAYLHPGARLPRRVDACALLSPFDPLVWHRPRVQRLFDFEYRIEIYVPAAKRRWGYYVLPFLLGDRLVARVDLKADREPGALLVRAAHLEDGVDAEPVAVALASELWTLAGWLELSSIEVERGGDFAATLGEHVHATEVRR